MNFIKRLLSSIILVPLILFIILKGSYVFNIFIIIIFTIMCFEWQRLNTGKFYSTIGFIFLFFSLMSIYILRNDLDNGDKLLILIISICIFTDIGGYVFGKIFKGPKLTKISPNKTIIGMVGSFLLPIISTFILQKYNVLISITNNSFSELLIFIFLISLVSQIGDLIISYFKRLSNVKDTGNIIPGHGGILDRVDGMVFVFPFAFICKNTFLFNF